MTAIQNLPCKCVLQMVVCSILSSGSNTVSAYTVYILTIVLLSLGAEKDATNSWLWITERSSTLVYVIYNRTQQSIYASWLVADAAAADDIDAERRAEMLLIALSPQLIQISRVKDILATFYDPKSEDLAEGFAITLRTLRVEFDFIFKSW